MGFVSSIFGAKNAYNATGATNLANTDYGGAINSALQGAGQLNPNLVDNSQSNQVNNSQNQLASLLQAQANGTGGPSPAQNLLTQATNQNINSGAAQIAGIKGMNPAAAARLIAQNGMNQNQQAANQAGVLQANQQLNAQSSLANLLNAQRGQDINQAQGNTSAGLQAMGQNTNLIGTLGGLQNQQNNTQVQNSLGAQNINAQIAGGNAQTNAGIVGGVIGGGSAALSGAMGGGGGKWKGGEVGYDEGGFVEGDPSANGVGEPEAPQVGGAAAGVDAGSQVVQNVPQTPSNLPLNQPAPMQAAQMAMQTPQQNIVPQYGWNPSAYGGGDAIGQGLLAGAKAAGSAAKMFFMKGGGEVPGQAQVAGDSPANDTVDAKLSPGEVVIPRSKANDPEKAKQFLMAVKKHHEELNGPQGYAKVLAAHRALHSRVQELEKLAYGGMCG